LETVSVEYPDEPAGVISTPAGGFCYWRTVIDGKVRFLTGAGSTRTEWEQGEGQTEPEAFEEFTEYLRSALSVTAHFDTRAGIFENAGDLFARENSPESKLRRIRELIEDTPYTFTSEQLTHRIMCILNDMEGGP
jgi:hypothetical protein